MVSKATNATAFTRYAVVFSMPKGTPVLAARKGTVIRISPDKIDILHEDSTIGTYSHLERIVDDIVVGKTVSSEDIIGIAGTTEDNKDAYMQLTVWRPEPAQGNSLQVNSQRTGLAAVSFPLAFSRTASDKGTVLIQDQPVSRDKLPASRKQSKRK
ncbi:MAG: M23 family metallopeptidase [Geobacteraceae bacterium]|nr:M23 family metallopeptidase [Geobacteraceae bacterium]